MNSPALIQKVRSGLYRVYPPPASVLVAFSGGPDSVALALLLQELQYEVHLAYVNHGLRGEESLREAAWVEDFARKRGLPLYVREIAPAQLQGARGLHAAARRLRYQWMKNLVQEQGLTFAATAHTWDDQLETWLYRLTRAASLWHWEGIPYRRGIWVRPLLYCQRRELIAYLHAQSQPFFLDRSNYTPRYLRNQIRWWALPPLLRINPSLPKFWRLRYELHRLQKRRIEKLYYQLMPHFVEKRPYGAYIRAKPQRDLFTFIAQNLWRISFSQAQKLYSLLQNAHSGKRMLIEPYIFIRTPQGVEGGEAILWEPAWGILEIPPEPVQYQWGLWHVEAGRGIPSPAPFSLVWDEAKLYFPLRLRLWKQGDRLQPAGMEGHSRKVSDILREIGFYGFMRQHAPVVEDSMGTLIAVVGYRTSWDTAPSSETKESFYLRLSYGQPL
ncbi:MAG: tRNA lysidine(34) synthetase TilS [Bacteroidia bacterium]|nr:tRNA lysidine(34) synthetase TilS [Bacteroidia bacterium]MDW8235657.1 tRNA lysidine(34) synthetase TilS [Bacteroidia bacterium]